MRVGEPGGVYHFSTQSDLTVAGIVRKLGELMGKSFEEIAETVGERLGQDSRYWLDCTKAQRELGWRPEVDFEDGLRETIAWIEQSWDQIVQEPLEYAHKA